MEGAYKNKYSFIGEWYDNHASLIRRFNLFFYPTDETLEMFDLKNRKTFVRRVKVNGISLDSFYMGCTLNILGRLIKIIDFACEDTRKRLQKDIEINFAMIYPLTTATVGKIFTHFHEHNLRVTKVKKAQLTQDDIQFLYRTMVTHPTYPFLLDHLTGEMVYGMELVGTDAVKSSIKLLGDHDPQKAAAGTIRAMYGTDQVRNCVYVSPSLEAAIQDINYFFPPAALRTSRLRLTATLSNCTLCIVKPHAIREGKLGGAIEQIALAGFTISALNMLIVENVNAAEFYEVYKGIVPEYQGMVEELSSGPCVAMEVVCRDKNLNTAVEFRKIVGPTDPEVARLLRPHTLRAKFGNTKVQNAIHCSDLPEDGLLEVEYFFKILDL